MQQSLISWYVYVFGVSNEIVNLQISHVVGAD
jgi:hypothetical protein